MSFHVRITILIKLWVGFQLNTSLRWLSRESEVSLCLTTWCGGRLTALFNIIFPPKVRQRFQAHQSSDIVSHRKSPWGSHFLESLLSKVFVSHFWRVYFYILIAGVPKMKTFRSATTLCIPDPTFNDITRHRLCLPQGSPVQRELLTGQSMHWNIHTKQSNVIKFLQ